MEEGGEGGREEWVGLARRVLWGRWVGEGGREEGVEGTLGLILRRLGGLGPCWVEGEEGEGGREGGEGR